MTLEQPFDVLQGLWPAPAQLKATRLLLPRHGGTSYIPIPTFSHPRVLVPMDVSGVERSILQGNGRRGQLIRTMWKAVICLPLRRLTVVEDPEGIESFLSEILATPIRMGVLLGPRRANQKAVLQIFNESGQTLAFAKLAHNALTAKLLAQEAKALTLLSRREPRTFRAPGIKFDGHWRDVPILVQDALSLSRPQPVSQQHPTEVMAEIAAIQGVELYDDDLPTAFTEQLSVPVQDTWSDIDLEPILAVRDTTLKRSGTVPFGSWHGDLGPWNMTTDGTETLIWDWERFNGTVPIGFDAAHYRAQRCLAAATKPACAWYLIARDVAAVLVAAGQSPAPAGRIAGMYLVAICHRYIADASDGPSTALRRRVEWLAAVSREAVSHTEKR